MKLKVSLLIVLILLPLTALFAQGSAETLTITTYYPSPYGVYKELRLYPNTSPSTCDANNEGAMYYDSTTNVNIIKFCKKTSNAPTYGWVALGDSFWAYTTGSTTNIHNTNSGYVGINTITPDKTLTVYGTVKVVGPNGGQLILPMVPSGGTAPTDNGSIWIQQ